ncbi:MAG: VOC family protein [Candidatus Thorarchaeota archaeon]|jgi:predicted lactoylglutathione lyase
MAGILFFKTKMLDGIVRFYLDRTGMTIWLQQKDCVILSHGNLLIGFCQRDRSETEGMITLFYHSRDEVDKIFTRLRDVATTKPKEDSRYHIYQFFAVDPEGRALEFQTFLHPLQPLKVEPFLQGQQAAENHRQ